jgi:hypothetical protein
VWFRQHGAQQMKQIQRHHLNLVVWVGLWGLCGLSHALGLGPVNSRVTMGEGLSLTVPVRLERGEHLSDECVSADVYFGDDKVSAFKVDVSLLQGSQGPYAIQVLSTLAVNEPVVTVQVAAGCLSHVARRYVVMADPLGLPWCLLRWRPWGLSAWAWRQAQCERLIKSECARSTGRGRRAACRVPLPAHCPCDGLRRPRRRVLRSSPHLHLHSRQHPCRWPLQG